MGGQHLLPQQQIDDQKALVDQLTGTVMADQAPIENARLQLDYARIKSPIDGITGVRQIDPGNMVHAADTTGIVVVTQMDPIAVLFTLPQDDLPDVAKQQRADGPLQVEAQNRDGSQTLGTGKLELIDNQINQGTATMRLKAIFPNPDARAVAEPVREGPAAPDGAQGCAGHPGGRRAARAAGAFVYVANGDKAEVRAVTVDRIAGRGRADRQGSRAGRQGGRARDRASSAPAPSFGT